MLYMVHAWRGTAGTDSKLAAFFDKVLCPAVRVFGTCLAQQGTPPCRVVLVTVSVPYWYKVRAHLNFNPRVLPQGNGGVETPPNTTQQTRQYLRSATTVICGMTVELDCSEP